MVNLKEARAEEPDGVALLRADLIRVALPSPTLAPATRTNSYLFPIDGGWALFDVGGLDDDSMDPLWRAIDEHCGGAIAAIVISHEHEDHHSGLTRVRARYGEVPLYADPHVIERLAARYNAPLAATRPLVEGARLGALRFDKLEGHALGHFCAVHDEYVLCADMMAGLGTIVVAPPEGSMRDYFASLHRLIALGDRPCYPAHGPEMASTSGYAQAYLAHRQAREAKILAQVTPTPKSLATITAGAYDDVPKELLRLAEVAALAHLQKLVEDGTIVSACDTWSRPPVS